MNEDIREAYNFEFVGGRLCLDFTNTVSNYDADRGNERFKSYPALVVWGEHDRLVSVAHGRAYAEGLPSARLVVVPGAGHYPYLEQPEAFAQAVGTFLRA